MPEWIEPRLHEKLVEGIDGWFDFLPIYRALLQQFPKPDHAYGTFVEIGAYKGKSTLYAAEAIKLNKLPINFHTVDTFLGTAGEHDSDPDVIGKKMYQTFTRNIRPVRDYVTVHKGFSADVASQFKAGTVDAVFIDGGHSMLDILSDIAHWLPKMQGKSFFGGHDADFPQVIHGVSTFALAAGKQVKIVGRSWMFAE